MKAVKIKTREQNGQEFIEFDTKNISDDSEALELTLVGAVSLMAQKGYTKDMAKMFAIQYIDTVYKSIEGGQE